MKQSALKPQEIEYAVLSKHAPSFARISCKGTAAQKAGKRYEAAALRHLVLNYGRAIPLPWIEYKLYGETGPRWCQPDGLLFDFRLGHVWIIECKIRHVAAAFIKLRDLYIPLMRILLPAKLWTITGLEMVPSFDCDVSVPVADVQISMDSHLPVSAFGVLVWKPIRILH